jgi:gluconolactonase
MKIRHELTVMMLATHLAMYAGIGVARGWAQSSAAQPLPAAAVPEGRADATIDLATREGTALVKGTWRYSDTKIIEIPFRKAGADGQPGSEPSVTYDYTPHAGGVNFDDSGWETLEPTTLSKRRGNGRLGFNWYRLNITIPAHIGSFSPAGITAVFETSADDYAEIWVNGELTRGAGQSGGSVIKGWNAVNRLVVGRNVRPGQKIQLAIFGINGPLSNPPTNYIYLRHAKLEFYAGSPDPVALMPQEVNVEVERRDPAINAIVPLNPKIYKIAEGFHFTEGPVWVSSTDKASGFLLFSDPNANMMYRYAPDEPLGVFRAQSGYSGADIAEYGQPGSNGITRDKEGRIVFCQHGNHAIVRLEKDGTLTTLVDNYRGKRLNSPNDLVCKSDGAIYFTDPPYGLPRLFDDARKALPFSGVYRLKDGKLTLLTQELGGPNGLAFSPDEKFLYVTNWDERVRNSSVAADKKKIVMRYAVNADGTLSSGKVFFDMGNAPDAEALDGIKIDRAGNLYVSGPGGVWIISAEGKHLGTIVVPQLPANLAWGDADGKTLYLTARTGLYRMRLNIEGIRP